MYVNPFGFGVLCTITVGALAIIALALYSGRKK